ncbi:granzyme B(G,H)-like [Salvelinus namaycush]|uniref:Granzyme B(G,H)-like n=1 Tax=Salvelinus namaycush TaxID=8040 RepID=A0A8U0R624_SALNM|nr:granzyme B(G,H)-like [Salvelinus alpinus]XP_038854827.1 granzyme B(G,H)-like [Salvelinus namaycush]
MAATSVLLLLVTLLPPQGLTAHQDSGIVNGEKTKTNSKPYMVSVQERNKETEKREHICGGFLVSDNFVMTAAHCYTSGVQLTVVVGVHNIKKWEHSAQRIGVKSYYINDYNPETHKNDIMLLELKTPTPRRSSVKPIPVAKKDLHIKAGAICNVAGWGATETNGFVNADLLDVNVAVVDRGDCQRTWRRAIPTSMICAGGTADDKGFCQGDSGGPLVCGGIAVGVVSFNDADYCNQSRAPNVYTNISTYLPWIKKVTGLKSVN